MHRLPLPARTSAAALLVFTACSLSHGGYPGKACQSSSECFASQGEYCNPSTSRCEPIPDGPIIIDGPLDPDLPYSPEPLSPGDVSPADQTTLAQRFNPAQVYTHPALRSTPVDYTLVEGGTLLQAPYTGTVSGGTFLLVTEADTTTVTPQPDLINDDWSGLPEVDSMDRPLAYFIDVPGNNLGAGYDEEDWTNEYASRIAPYPPTQYAHFFWMDPPRGLLAIQYWFYYPYNKLWNSHEADWEHVNVVLEPAGPSDWQLAFVQFFAHSGADGFRADQIYRLGDQAAGNGDHVVVFTGGSACWNSEGMDWCGRGSGASFPFPGTYNDLAAECASGSNPEVCGTPARPIHANDFEVVVLPNVGQIVPPNLSWYRLPTFMAGSPTVAVNASALISVNTHRAPVQPSAHPDFELSIRSLEDMLGNGNEVRPFAVPGGWTLINDPGL